MSQQRHPSPELGIPFPDAVLPFAKPPAKAEKPRQVARISTGGQPPRLGKQFQALAAAKLKSTHATKKTGGKAPLKRSLFLLPPSHIPKRSRQHT
ncbi:hypothetical protein P7C70_g4458, partial [Phenoliferia sp. Uapishka_3]